MRRAGVLLAVAAAVLAEHGMGAQLAPQTSPPVFHSGISYVQIDASVLDRNRNPIRGLAAGDFTVLEDGQPQKILSFSEVNVPDFALPRVGAAREATPDARANDSAMDGRLVVILLDDGQSPVGRPEENRTKEVAKLIVDRLGPADLAAVFFTRLQNHNQDFTSDHAKLQAAINAFVPFRPANASADPGDSDDLMRNSLNHLETIAESLAALPGRRKALFYFGVGVRMPAIFPPSTEFYQLTQIFRDAQRANLNVYPIDPSGLTGLDDFGVAERVGLQPPSSSLASGSEFYRTVAENTGGLAMVNRNEFESVVAGALRENGLYHLLGYESPNLKTDGQFRRLNVSVNRPGVTVRTRSGYYGPTAAAAAPQAAVRPVPNAPSPAPVAPATLAALPRAPATPTLDEVLARLAAYLTAYADQYSSTIATEHYLQTFNTARTMGHRTLDAEFGIVRLPGSSPWLGFRDVTRVDGKPIADRVGRLATLFSNPSAGALKQADTITGESTRFNIGPIDRTLNNPAVVLEALDARNQSRFTFSKDGEATLGGTRAWTLRFTEQARPTFITTFEGRDEPLTGRAWVEPTAGRLRRVELVIPGFGLSGPYTATINVTFHEDPRLRLWLPATMTERYDVNMKVVATGDASYTDYRRFGVETREELAK